MHFMDAAPCDLRADDETILHVSLKRLMTNQNQITTVSEVNQMSTIVVHVPASMRRC